MKIDEYITALRKNTNIIVSISNDDLKIRAPKSALTKEIVEDIRARKTEIINFFKTINGNTSAIPQASEKRYYKSSSAQKRLYFIQELDKTSLAYNIPQVLDLEGKLDKEKLADAFDRLVKRHESLRTSFCIIDNDVYQIVEERYAFKIENFYGQEEDVQTIIEKFVRPFELNKGPLIRVGLIQIAPLRHILMVDTHHIVSDGVSQGIMIKEFMALYNNEDLAPLHLQYKDYAEWQQTPEQQQKIENQKDFWINEFSEELNTLELPTDYTRPSIKNYDGSFLTLNLDTYETSKLNSIAESEGGTMFLVLLSIYSIWLSKLSNEEDIVIGFPVAGRQHSDLEDIIGMFVNTLPLRSCPKDNLTFSEFLKELKGKVLSCLDNQAYPYEELISELNINRSPSHNPLFDVMFAFQNFDDPEIQIGDLRIVPKTDIHFGSKFDITLKANEVGGIVVLKFEYSTQLFKKETLERFIRYFKKIVSTVVINPYIRISDIDLVTEKERHQLLYEFNDTEFPYQQDDTVISLFEKQAQRTPQKRRK